MKLIKKIFLNYIAPIAFYLLIPGVLVNRAIVISNGTTTNDIFNGALMFSGAIVIPGLFMILTIRIKEMKEEKEEKE